MHTVRINPNVSATAAGGYLAKGSDWTPAEEMTRGDLKTGRTGSRTALQILADYYQAGDTRLRDLWREYSRVTRGLDTVRWSRGLRAVILGSATHVEPTDEELAAEDTSSAVAPGIVNPVTARTVQGVARVRSGTLPPDPWSLAGH